MRDNYDFSDAVKNPFAGRIKGKYSVTVHYDFTTQDAVLADMEHYPKTYNNFREIVKEMDKEIAEKSV